MPDEAEMDGIVPGRQLEKVDVALALSRFDPFFLERAPPQNVMLGQSDFQKLEVRVSNRIVELEKKIRILPKGVLDVLLLRNGAKNG